MHNMTKITKDTVAHIAISKESNIGKAYKTHREKKEVSSKTKNDTDWTAEEIK